MYERDRERHKKEAIPTTNKQRLTQGHQPQRPEPTDQKPSAPRTGAFLTEVRRVENEAHDAAGEGSWKAKEKVSIEYLSLNMGILTHQQLGWS